MPLTVSDIRADCAAATGLCPDDSRVLDVINKAVERLLYKGKFKGCYGRYRVCVNDACISWPREIETIEAFALDAVPGEVRNEWYEFLGSGPGILDSNSCNGTSLIDKGVAAAFDDVTGTGKKLAVYSDVTENAASRIILQFFNTSGQWVRTQFGGQWIDGESIALPAAGAYAYTTNECMAGGFLRAIKARTNGTTRLYEYNTADASLKSLAYYQPDETRPEYRRSLIPNLANMATASADCDYHTVEVVGKLRYTKVYNDNDFLLISHAGALELACRAIKEERASRWDEAAISWAAAVQCLQEQLHHYQGDGAVQPIRVQGSETWGAAVQNLV